MKGNVNEIYTVEGSQFTTVESLRAIARAKEEAQKSKSIKRVFLNGNPIVSINKSGCVSFI